MPRGNPNLKKGKPPPHKTNSHGRPKEPETLKELRALTKTELVEIGNMVVKGDMAWIRTVATDPYSPALHVMLAAVVVKIINKGDMTALNILLDRLIGKVPNPAPDNPYVGPVETRPQIILTLPDNGRSAPK